MSMHRFVGNSAPKSTHRLGRFFLVPAFAFGVSLLVACGIAPADETETDPASVENSPEKTDRLAIAESDEVADRFHRTRRWGGGGTTPTATATTTATSAPTTTPTATATSTSAPPAPTSTSGTLPASRFRGVNLSGAEFGSALPGVFGTDYTFPTTSEVDYYVGKGLTTFRIPFMWERLQATQYGSFDATYLGRLDTLVNYATKTKGGYVVLNPQNFARYYNDIIGSAAVPDLAFANFWKQLSAHYASNSHVMFNLMNEPHDLPTEQWVAAANAAIAAIRAVPATNTIICPGNNWTDAYSWAEDFYGTANSVALLKVEDPINNTLFEAHQYLDSDSSGSSATCESTTIGSQRLEPFVAWLRANKKRGFLGEFAGGKNATCYAAVTDMLNYVKTNEDVLLGWLWWGAGPWWGTSYIYALDPVNGVDQPTMPLLTSHLN